MSRRLFALPALLALAVAATACGSPAQKSPGTTSTPAASSVVSTSPASGRAVATPNTWTALGSAKPLAIVPNRPGISADPTHPAVLAYCAPGSVQVSRDGGKSWTAVSTAGVVAATAKSPYPVKTMSGESAPTCRTAVADTDHQGTIYASFDAGPANGGMPPIFNVPVYSTDGGAHWGIVPSPTGFAAGGFGQFAVTGGGVDAVFGRAPAVFANAPATNATKMPPFGVVTTADGGATWKAGALTCPAQGPCLAWGPAASGTGSCAMHAYPQPVEASADRGKTWTALAAPAGSPLPILVNGCGANQLVALSPSRVALVGNGTVEPADAVRVSDDSGKTWTDVALPALPGNGSITPGLHMLPDGSLLVTVSMQLSNGQFGAQLALLQPGAKAWCTVSGVTLKGAHTDPTTLQAVGNRLMWIENGSTAKSVPLASVHC